MAIELMHRNALENMGQITAQIQSGQRLYLLALVVILMPLNIFLESSKWRFAASKLEKISLKLRFSDIILRFS